MRWKIQIWPVLACLAVGFSAEIHDVAAEEPATAPHLTLHEELVEAWRGEDRIDLKNPRAVLWHVFSRIPAEARVYPSENYYYWRLEIDGRDIRGNLQLSAKDREEGFIGFAYSEARVPAGGKDDDRLRVHARFGSDDGVSIRKAGASIYDAGYSDHFVRFHLEDLPQTPPGEELIRSEEVFIGRTLDDSGLGFLLLFQTRQNFFFWVLDPSQPVPEHFAPAGQGETSVIGRRTGFVFWIDAETGGRKILAAVNQHNIESNSDYDGPFDQLPDNHVAGSKIQTWMERENPELKGRIDRFGYYLGDDPPRRVALARYATYGTPEDLRSLLEKAADAPDPRWFFSSQGRQR